VQIAARVANLDAIVQPSAGEHAPLPEHAIAGVIVRNVRALVFATGASLSNKQLRKAKCYVCGCAIEQEGSIARSAQRLVGRRATSSDGPADNKAARLRNSPCPMVH
jgi:hypothetical protein